MTVNSLVLFGSHVSGGGDHQSDKDLLVICDSQSKKKAIAKYSDLGYSVSVYTLSQLDQMRLRGSLFLQHIKHESHAIYDKDGVFRDFIKDCCFFPPSDDEIECSKLSLVNALKCPVSGDSILWLADYLFVLSRDYFIKYFAKKGRLIFNIIQLRNEIVDEFRLGNIEADVLLDLRKNKSIYRSGAGGCDASVMRSIAVWSNVLIKIFNIYSIEKITRYDYLFDGVAEIFESAYSMLRYVESLRIMFPFVKCKEQYELRVSKMILGPNHYSSTSVNGRNFLSIYLDEFRLRACDYIYKTDLSANVFIDALEDCCNVSK